MGMHRSSSTHVALTSPSHPPALPPVRRPPAGRQAWCTPPPATPRRRPPTAPPSSRGPTPCRAATARGPAPPPHSQGPPGPPPHRRIMACAPIVHGAYTTWAQRPQEFGGQVAAADTNERTMHNGHVAHNRATQSSPLHLPGLPPPPPPAVGPCRPAGRGGSLAGPGRCGSSCGPSLASMLLRRRYPTPGPGTAGPHSFSSAWRPRLR